MRGKTLLKFNLIVPECMGRRLTQINYPINNQLSFGDVFSPFGSPQQVTHVWNNSNLRRKDEQREHLEHKECQYKGTIADDDKSIVAVSLCDGMVS